MNQMAKNLPTSLIIAGHPIAIETFGKETCLVGGIFAAYDNINAKIIVCDELDKVMTLDSLIHEIGHAIYFFYGLNDESDEETNVNQMGIGWSQIWVDNPDLVKFLNYAVK